jgi:probable rRNA maturation factor
MDVDCDIGAHWNESTDWAAVARICVTAMTNITPELNNPRLSMSVVFTDDSEVQALNHEYRQKDAPTNVLSFPMLASDDIPNIPNDRETLLGDIILAHETCAREAAAKNITLEAHAQHLIIHGTLHLLGYDHISEEDALGMETLERRIMALLGLHDPYDDEDDTN